METSPFKARGDHKTSKTMTLMLILLQEGWRRSQTHLRPGKGTDRPGRVVNEGIEWRDYGAGSQRNEKENYL